MHRAANRRKRRGLTIIDAVEMLRYVGVPKTMFSRVKAGSWDQRDNRSTFAPKQAAKNHVFFDAALEDRDVETKSKLRANQPGLVRCYGW
jgi:hypothetical protein